MAHIPSSDTHSLELLRFSDALKQYSAPHARTYDPEKWLYIPDYYTEYRYILGTRGERPLIAIGINPSTAEPDHLDNTLKSVERIALSNGYDSFIMFNVYAERATDPADMEREFNESLHRENMAAFDYILSLSRERPAVWAAWGTIVRVRPYLMKCMTDMTELGRQHNALWYSCGARSKNGGHPHHPLYLRKDASLDKFDIDGYISGLKISSK